MRRSSAIAPPGHAGELICIEPFPQPRLTADMPQITLIERPVEQVPLETFDALQANDILFIDSSHAVKFGGDVCREFLEILPRLKPGVWVHVHDIFFPHDYPAVVVDRSTPGVQRAVPARSVPGVQHPFRRSRRELLAGARPSGRCASCWRRRACGRAASSVAAASGCSGSREPHHQCDRADDRADPRRCPHCSSRWPPRPGGPTRSSSPTAATAARCASSSAQRVGSEAGLDVRYLQVTPPNAVRQRKAAIAVSTGSLLLMLDDDVVPEPGCVAALVDVPRVAWCRGGWRRLFEPGLAAADDCCGGGILKLRHGIVRRRMAGQSDRPVVEIRL